MLVDLKNLQGTLRQLRKSLKKLPQDPSQEEVHQLRTRSRRFEAILTALNHGDDKDAVRLLEAIRAIRKAAGSVRDMDVITAKALTLRDPNDEALARLVKHLGGRRMEYARKLLDDVADQRKPARRGLKRQLKRIEDDFAHNGDGRQDGSAEKAVTAPLRLAQELSQWPTLTENNLHSFRIKAKQLRYILQLADDRDQRFVDMLERVTDTIGDWHDWHTLSKLSSKILKNSTDGEVMKDIQAMEQKALRRALAEANRMRRTCLDGAKQPRNQETPHKAARR